MAGDESGTTLGQPHLAKQDLHTLVIAHRILLTTSRVRVQDLRRFCQKLGAPQVLFVAR